MRAVDAAGRGSGTETSEGSEIKRILSIDGGGIRGMFPATFLADLEKQAPEPLHRYFDLIVGTSTGGIIAIGLAPGIRAQVIAELYETKGPEIFFQERTGLRGRMDRWLAASRHLIAPKYPAERLRAELHRVLGDQKIGDARTRMMVPAFNAITKRVYIFKTRHANRFTTDDKDLAVDAAMATAAAPTFFPRHLTCKRPLSALVD